MKSAVEETMNLVSPLEVEEERGKAMEEGEESVRKCNRKGFDIGSFIMGFFCRKPLRFGVMPEEHLLFIYLTPWNLRSLIYFYF